MDQGIFIPLLGSSVSHPTDMLGGDLSTQLDEVMEKGEGLVYHVYTDGSDNYGYAPMHLFRVSCDLWRLS